MVLHMEIPVVKFSKDGHKFCIVKMSKDTRSGILVLRNGSPFTFAALLPPFISSGGAFHEVLKLLVNK